MDTRRNILLRLEHFRHDFRIIFFYDFSISIFAICLLIVLWLKLKATMRTKPVAIFDRLPHELRFIMKILNDLRLPFANFL